MMAFLLLHANAILGYFAGLLTVWLLHRSGYLESSSGKSLSRLLFSVLVVGTMYAVIKGIAISPGAASAIVGLGTGLAGAWIAGKITGKDGADGADGGGAQ